mgnify:CR=1 FL=1
MPMNEEFKSDAIGPNYFEKLQMSWLQNDIDTIVTLLYSTKYKLVNLQ